MKRCDCPRSAAYCGRRGLTLLEVLIAIFVLSVGLMGLAALLPVSRSQMAEGVKYDRVAVLGRQAVHDLETRRDLMDPSNWISPAGAVTTGSGFFLSVCPTSPAGWPTGSVLAPPSDTYNYQWPINSPVQVIPAAPFILDPLGCSYPQNLANNANLTPAGTGGLSTTSASLFGPTFFPPSGYSLDGAGLPGSPALNRITVPRANSSLAPMPYALASAIFRCSDEVIFNLPSDTTERPTADNPQNPSGQLKPKVQGDYSWFAVVDNVQRPWNPGLDGGWGIQGIDDNGDGVVDDLGEAGWPNIPPFNSDIALWHTSGGELWNVWVVVCYKRNLDIGPATAGAVPPERMLYCDFLTAPLPPSANPVQVASAGQGGGDVEIYIPQTLPSGLTTSPDWLVVKPNQWIMVSCWANLNASGLAAALASPVRGQLPIVSWFRISSAGDIEPVAGGWKRKLTLDGPDFNPYKFVDAVGAPGGYQSCYATIVDGVVGVVQTTIEEGE